VGFFPSSPRLSLFFFSSPPSPSSHPHLVVAKERWKLSPAQEVLDSASLFSPKNPLSIMQSAVSRVRNVGIHYHFLFSLFFGFLSSHLFPPFWIVSILSAPLGLGGPLFFPLSATVFSLPFPRADVLGKKNRVGVQKICPLLCFFSPFLPFPYSPCTFFALV